VSTPEQVSPGLRHYLEILRKHKRIAIIALIFVPVAAYVYSILESPAYEARSEVLLSHQNIAAELTGVQDPTGGQISDRPIQTQADLARVPEVIRRTLVAAKYSDLGIGEFLDSSSVSPKENSDLLDFRVQSRQPWDAERLATAYAQQFTRYRLELDTAPARRARAQLQARIRELRREGQTGGRLYNNLLDLEQQLATFEALQTSNAYVVRTALGADQVAPTTRRNVVLGLGLGALLAVALAALAHALDTRGHTVRTLEERLGVPLLAQIPAPPAGKGRLMMRTDPFGAHAEAYRVLRANLEFVNRDRGARVIMATSATQGEGKSTTIANVALAYAREGKRVIVVDLDLHRPTLAHIFDVPASPGVIEAAYGQTGLDNALRSVPSGAGTNALNVLPAEPPRRDVGEFTSSNQLRLLFESLRERADIVFVDTPPLLVSADAITVGSIADGILLVTAKDSLQWDSLDDVTRALSMCAAPTLGWVITGADAMSGYSAYAGPNGRPTRRVPVAT
jgi:capsular exopolysaccharide synthesis family protein